MEAGQSRTAYVVFVVVVLLVAIAGAIWLFGQLQLIVDTRSPL